MSHQFINPNWHPLLVHYPIALVIVGLLIEIFTAFNRRAVLRTAGRWMIALGVASAIPTLLSGIYAFRDVVTNQPMNADDAWHTVRTQSHWSDLQWTYMIRHIWLNAIATAIGAIVVFLWIATGPRLRRKLYALCFLGIVAVVALTSVGGWYSGESVYRLGTAVGPMNVGPKQNQEIVRDIWYYAPPLQTHLIIAGLAVAASLAAFALMLRRWEKPAPVTATVEDPALSSEAAQERLIHDAFAPAPYADDQLATHPPRVYPGWFYFTAAVLGLATAFFGAWATMDELNREALENNLKLLKDPDHRRLLIHVILGVAIIVLPLLAGLFVRFARRTRIIPLALASLMVLAIAAQVFYGVLLLYDGNEGPLFSFSTPETTQPESRAPTTAPASPRTPAPTSSPSPRAGSATRP